jgi:hypothetical protein
VSDSSSANVWVVLSPQLGPRDVDNHVDAVFSEDPVLGSPAWAS